MEDTQQPPLMASFPPGTSKWTFDSSAGGGFNDRSGASGGVEAGGGSFGQESGYASYQSPTPNNTFNLSSRHGVSCSLATIDEVNEGNCSMNDSNSSMAKDAGSNILTPRTAASIDRISNFHLTTPNSSVVSRHATRRPFAFNYVGRAGNSECSFETPSTPERLPVTRSVSFDTHDTPLSTSNRSNHQSQLTPHKSKDGQSIKRKISSLRGKLYSDGDMVAEEPSDENQPNELNDSLNCRRLDDISPIPKVKRHKPNEIITSLIRSSTPKTASSQQRFHVDPGMTAPADQYHPLAKGTFRKFQSFSPSKIQTNRQVQHRLIGRTAPPVVRQDALIEQEHTPKKKSESRDVGCVTPSKEHRVLAEIHQTQHGSDDLTPPVNLAGLLDAPILEYPRLSVDDQLERTISTVHTAEDFSMTPTKANLIDPELSESLPFASEDFVARHAANFCYGPTLHSIIEESPIREQIGVGCKLLPPKTPSSGSKASVRKLKRLGRNSSGGSLQSPLRQVVRTAASPKVLGRANASFQNQTLGMYCGMKQLNILQRLYERNQDTLHMLLGYLTDKDLVDVVRVSRGWRAIIQSFPKRWNSLQKYLKKQLGNKENHRRSGDQPILKPTGKDGRSSGATVAGETFEPTSSKAFPSVSDASAMQAVVRRPFKICNSLDGSYGPSPAQYVSFDSVFGNVTMPEPRRRSSGASVTHSPPVSPSKRKFITNQKIASHLKQSEQLRTCPRCERPSRIVFSCSSKNGQNKARSSAVAARLEKSYTLPDPDSGINLNGTINNNILSADRHTFDNSAGRRNNNDYSSNSSNQQYMNNSPNRVRKNLFNSIDSSTAGPGRTMGSSLVTKPSNPGRRDSSESLHQHTNHNIGRMKLRSASKSVDHSSSSSIAPGSESLLGLRDSKCDYAICSGQNCGFKFCIKCLCEYHPDTVCLDLAPNSPSKEEERGRPNVACSRQSRRSLQRLCRKL